MEYTYSSLQIQHSIKLPIPQCCRQRSKPTLPCFVMSATANLITHRSHQFRSFQSWIIRITVQQQTANNNKVITYPLQAVPKTTPNPSLQVISFTFSLWTWIKNQKLELYHRGHYLRHLCTLHMQNWGLGWSVGHLIISSKNGNLQVLEVFELGECPWYSSTQSVPIQSPACAKLRHKRWARRHSRKHFL